MSKRALWVDHCQDPQAWAESLGISRAAVDLYLDAEVVDLHNDLYVPARLYGYNVHKRHKPGPLGARFTNQTDLPRLHEAKLAAVFFDIATNPLRRGARRGPQTLRNIARIQADLDQQSERFRLVSSYSEYRAAREAGLTAGFIGIQGGQAFQHTRETLETIPDVVSRITLIHLTNSRIGCTSSPLGLDKGALSARGVELVEVMNQKRILVDLAHVNRAGYMHAVEVHDKSQPLICTHTGVSAVRPHWRNIDDEQIRAISDTGGTIGIIFHSMFIGPRTFLGLGRCEADLIVEHIAHVISTAGEEHVSIGTDYDGMIIPPMALQQVTDMPRIVQLMLDRGFSELRIRRILGLNALRVVREVRP